MSSILTTVFLGSAVVAGSALGLTLAQESSTTESCVGELCPPKSPMQDVPDQRTNRKKIKSTIQGEQLQGQDQSSPDQALPRKKRRLDAQQQKDVNVDVDVNARVQAGEGKWRFDPNRHQRRRSKSATFRFYYGGFWYPQPYWQVYTVRSSRISCGEGRAIVAQRFNRVRVVECRGGTYTYLGRRSGATFRILLNSRSGRIVGRMLI